MSPGYVLASPVGTANSEGLVEPIWCAEWFPIIALSCSLFGSLLLKGPQDLPLITILSHLSLPHGACLHDLEMLTDL